MKLCFLQIKSISTPLFEIIVKMFFRSPECRHLWIGPNSTSRLQRTFGGSRFDSFVRNSPLMPQHGLETPPQSKSSISPISRNIKFPISHRLRPKVEHRRWSRLIRSHSRFKSMKMFSCSCLTSFLFSGHFFCTWWKNAGCSWCHKRFVTFENATSLRVRSSCLRGSSLPNLWVLLVDYSYY
jgi:hypothetical protein